MKPTTSWRSSAKTTRRLSAAALAALTLGAGAVLLQHTASGPMALNEDAQKLHERTIDTDTVDYYNQVCDQLDAINTASRDVLNVAETSIGDDSAAINAAYTEALVALRNTTVDSFGALTRLDEHAPRVMLPNNTYVDYAGALAPTTAVLDENVRIINEQIERVHAHAPDSNAGGDSADDADGATPTDDNAALAAETAGDTYTQALTGIAETNSKARTSLGEVFDQALILSEPTVEQIRQATSCAPIIGGPMADEEHRDETLDALVDYQRRVMDANDAFGQATFMLTGISEYTGADAGTVHELVLRTLDAALQAARDGAAGLGTWVNPYEERSAEWIVTNTHVAARDNAANALDEFGLELQVIRDEIAAGDADNIATIQDAFSNHADALREAQINAARAFVRANLDFDPATAPTSEAVQALDNPADTPVDDAVVATYRDLHTARTDIIAAAQALSDTTSDIEGMPVDAAITQLADAVYHVRDVAHAATLPEGDAQETATAVGSELGDLAAQIDGLAPAQANEKLPELMRAVSAAQTRLLNAIATTWADHPTPNAQTRSSVQNIAGADANASASE